MLLALVTGNYLALSSAFPFFVFRIMKDSEKARFIGKCKVC